MTGIYVLELAYSNGTAQSSNTQANANLSGILRAAEVLIHSSRGDEVLLMTAQTEDAYKIRAIVRSAQYIHCDQASLATIKAAIQTARAEWYTL